MTILEIGQSAAKKLPGEKFKVQRLSERSTTKILLEKVAFSSIVVYYCNMKKYKIYTLCCSNTKEIRYIGVTVRELKERFSQHLWNSRNFPNTPCSKWIKSLHGKVEIELIEEVDEISWEYAEQFWISQFRTWGFRLLNLSNGGKGIVIGRRMESENKKKRPVVQYTMDGQFIRRYDSIKEAVKDHNLKSLSSLTNHLKKGNGRHVGGFRWSYEGTSPKQYNRVKVTIKGKQYIYPDVMTAASLHGFDRNNAMRFLKGKRGPVRGLQIEYDIV